jgi:hypothetical protein
VIPFSYDAFCIQADMTVAYNYPDGIINLDGFTDVALTLCEDGSYCCGNLNYQCCLQNQGNWIKDLVVYPHDQNPFSTATPSSSSSTTSTSATQSSTSSTSHSSGSATNLLTTSASNASAVQTSTISGSVVTLYAPPTQSSSDLPSRDKITFAIGLGTGLGGGTLIAILLGVIAFLCVRKRRRALRNGGRYHKGEEDSIYAREASPIATNVELADKHDPLPFTPRELDSPETAYPNDNKKYSPHIQEMAG